MQLQECLAEASAEGGSRLGDAALGTSELSGETTQEVVLGLLSVENRYWRQYTKGVGAQEDHLLGSGCVADGTHDVLDVVDGIAHTGILGHALVGEVDLALGVNSNVLEQCIAVNGVVDVGLSLLVEVDDLGIATALEVEDTVVVPTVLVVTDEFTLRIGAQGGLTSA